MWTCSSISTTMALYSTTSSASISLLYQSCGRLSDLCARVEICWRKQIFSMDMGGTGMQTATLLSKMQRASRNGVTANTREKHRFSGVTCVVSIGSRGLTNASATAIPDSHSITQERAGSASQPRQAHRLLCCWFSGSWFAQLVSCPFPSFSCSAAFLSSSWCDCDELACCMSHTNLGLSAGPFPLSFLLFLFPFFFPFFLAFRNKKITVP